MTVKEYFYQAFTIDRMIRAVQSQLEEVREKRFLVSAIQYDKDKVQTSINHENFNALSDRLMELEQKYVEDEIRLTELKMELKKHIDGLGNPIQQLIMTERYINLKRWEDVAADNGYSWKWVHEIHKQSLKNLNSTLKYTIEK